MFPAPLTWAFGAFVGTRPSVWSSPGWSQRPVLQPAPGKRSQVKSRQGIATRPHSLLALLTAVLLGWSGRKCPAACPVRSIVRPRPRDAGAQRFSATFQSLRSMSSAEMVSAPRVPVPTWTR